ncbi:MAG: hypothetical protein NZ522_09170, partial [Chitinophagales bacterium]|nr:hypothetical protein [Chitinophagales bacterium]
MKLSSLSVFVLSIAAATYLSSCKKEKENNVDSPTCDNSQPPLVMVHGALASGDTYASQFMRFSANGFCEDRMFVFDWNTVGSDGQDTTRLRLFI